jgi:hypothetical protein
MKDDDIGLWETAMMCFWSIASGNGAISRVVYERVKPASSAKR